MRAKNKQQQPKDNAAPSKARDDGLRRVMTAYFPMFIATLSLLTSIYNGYLNGRFVDLIQNNVARVEYMKTCKEIIDVYFQVKVRAGALAANGEAERAGKAPGNTAASDRTEGAAAVARFGALGTWLANLRNEDIRYRYTQITWAIDKAMAEARDTKPAELGKLFAPADKLFGELNDDCVKSAKDQVR